MPKKSKRKVHKQSQAGFTLLEAALALTVNTMVLLLLMGGMEVIRTADIQMEKTQDAEWHLFLIQLEHELEDELLVQKTSTTIRTKSQNQADPATYTYEFRVNKVLRYKNGEGYHPMLLHVKALKYEVTNEGISIQATLSDNQMRSAHLILPKVPI
ncbi:competence type IV pilus minor pilin ComGF [Trichococcus sp.]|uniref:competence type IV pilus minor pilin ComGF n=1 Tax=Trichococcus sp. TaxID=1985464 RepID=UPI003C7BB8A6